MSKLQIIPTFLPNKSLTLNAPEEFLKNQFSTENSRNMEFYNQVLQGRLGLSATFDTIGTGPAVELSGPVQLIDQFWKFDGTWSLMFATTKDIYKFNQPGTGSSSSYDILTPVYTTGTISVGTGASSDIVTGAGGAAFTTGGIKAGDFIKVGTGTPSSLDTWYEIESKDSQTQLTLVGTGLAGQASTGYTIRKCFAGTSTDFWRARTFQDKNLGDVWIATNGVDTPIRYTGTGQVQALTGLPTNFVSARFVEVWKDRVIFLWCVFGSNEPQREHWSAVADCEDWDDADFQDFIEDGLWITGTGIMASSHVVFRERDAMIGRYVGGDYIFAYDKSNSCAGVWSPNSLVILQREAYYWGPDNKFHYWDMISDKIISESILPHTKDYNPNLEQYIYGWEVEAKNQIRWLCPFSDTSYNNEIVVYNHVEDIIQIWEHKQAQALCSIGEYLNIADLYLDDTVWGEYYLDEQDGFFDDRTFLSGAPQIIYGGYDGYVRKPDTGYDDDGVNYDRVFESVRDNFRMPAVNKRLWRQQIWLEDEPSGTVTVKIKKDDSTTYDAATKSLSLVNANRDVIKSFIEWNKTAQDFKTRIEATNHFALLGYLNYIFSKGMVKK